MLKTVMTRQVNRMACVFLVAAIALLARTAPAASAANAYVSVSCSAAAQEEASSAIVRSAELGCALSDLLERYANAIVVTNKWDVHVAVSNGQCSMAFAYSRSDLTFPKMASKRGVDGTGCDVYFGGRHNLTKYIEYKDGALHGPWLEFFANGRLRSYVNIHNGKTVGRRMFFDDNGRLVKECSDSKSLLDMPIKSSPRDGIDNPK